jgi:hypothetical protein
MGFALLVGARSVSAQCPGATNTPFGPDDSGVLTCTNTAAACENKVEQAVFVLAKAIIKCHAKQADAIAKGQPPFDEETCESAAMNSFTMKNTTVVSMSCPCVNLGSIASSWEAELDTTINALTYCDGWDSGTLTCTGTTAIDPTGDDQGCVNPTSAGEQKCQDKIGGCVASLVKNYTKCHKTAAKAFVKNHAFDEETCEQGPLAGKSAAERFNSCVAKASASGACAPCNATNQAPTLAAIDSMMDGSNNAAVYCTP